MICLTQNCISTEIKCKIFCQIWLTPLIVLCFPLNGNWKHWLRSRLLTKNFKLKGDSTAHLQRQVQTTRIFRTWCFVRRCYLFYIHIVIEIAEIHIFRLRVFVLVNDVIFSFVDWRFTVLNFCGKVLMNLLRPLI